MDHQQKALLIHRPFPNWLTRLLVPILVGMAIGILSGAFIYPRLTTELDPPVFAYEKVEASLRHRGVLSGVWIGGSCGVAVYVARLVISKIRRSIA